MKFHMWPDRLPDSDLLSRYAGCRFGKREFPVLQPGDALRFFPTETARRPREVNLRTVLKSEKGGKLYLCSSSSEFTRVYTGQLILVIANRLSDDIVVDLMYSSGYKYVTTIIVPSSTGVPIVRDVAF